MSLRPSSRRDRRSARHSRSSMAGQRKGMKRSGMIAQFPTSSSKGHFTAGPFRRARNLCNCWSLSAFVSKCSRWLTITLFLGITPHARPRLERDFYWPNLPKGHHQVLQLLPCLSSPCTPVSSLSASVHDADCHQTFQSPQC